MLVHHVCCEFAWRTTDLQSPPALSNQIKLTTDALAQAVEAANAGGSVVYAQGCAVNSTDKSGFAAATAAAAGADVVVLFLGIDETIEAESHDRMGIGLPGVQHDLAAGARGEGGWGGRLFRFV